MREIVDRARSAQGRWAAVPIRVRLRLLRGFRRRMARRASELIAAVPEGGRRAPGETFVAEFLPLVAACRFLERKAARLLRPRRLRWGRPLWLFRLGLEVRREPLGVVLIVGPANYPLMLPGIQALQALAAGNAVLLKPAPGCTKPLALLGELLDLEEGLWQVLPENHEVVASVLDAGVDRVVLTGSAATGRAVLAAAAPTLTPATMELSGSDAVVILEGADLGMAARAIAFGLGFNGSHTCIAPRRVFVPRRLEAALEARLVETLARLPARPVAGPVAARIRALVEEALAAGARLALGQLPPAAADGPVEIAPILVAGARPSLALLQEDLFAQVLSMVAIDSVEEAVEALAACPYGLGATLFGPEGPARKLATRLAVGQVVINDMIVPTADPRLPFGGRRQSGFGVTRGAEGLLEFTAPKAIAWRKGRFRPHFDRPAAQLEALLRGRTRT